MKVICEVCEKIQEFKKEDIQRIAEVADTYSLDKQGFLDMLSIVGGKCNKNGTHVYKFDNEFEILIKNLISSSSDVNIKIENSDQEISVRKDKIANLRKDIEKEEIILQEVDNNRDMLIEEREKYNKEFYEATGCKNLWRDVNIQISEENKNAINVANGKNRWPFKIKLSDDDTPISRCPIDYTFESPSYFSIDDDKYPISNFQDLELKVINEFIKRNKDNFHIVLELSGARGRKIFSRESKDLVRPILIEGTDIFVETGISGHYLAEVSYAIADKFGYYKNGRFKIGGDIYRLIFRPTGLSLKENISYTGCLTKLVENLVSINVTDFESKIQDARISKYFSKDFYSGGSGGGRSRLINKDTYLKVNFSAKDTIRVAFEIINVFGFSNSDLVFV